MRWSYGALHTCTGMGNLTHLSSIYPCYRDFYLLSSITVQIHLSIPLLVHDLTLNTVIYLSYFWDFYGVQRSHSHQSHLSIPDLGTPIWVNNDPILRNVFYLSLSSAIHSSIRWRLVLIVLPLPLLGLLHHDRPISISLALVIAYAHSDVTVSDSVTLFSVLHTLHELKGLSLYIRSLICDGLYLFSWRFGVR